MNIKKATLRGWRREFARHLRERGIEANATERAVRAQTKGPKADAIYRAARRGVSTHMEDRAEAVSSELLKGNLRVELSKAKMVGTREQVELGWRAISAILARQGHSELAAQVDRFVDQMRPPSTEKELIAAALLARTRIPSISTNPSVR